MQTRRQTEKPSPEPKSKQKALTAATKAFWRPPEPSWSRGPVPLAFSLPNPTVPETVEEAPQVEQPLAEVVPIKTTPKSKAKTKRTDSKVETDDTVAYQAWLEAFAGFPDYVGYQINRLPQHRVERKQVKRSNGATHLKRVHVCKEYVSWLLPGDKWGDPDGRRHRNSGGYPTREYYERVEGESSYMRKTATGSPRLVVNNDSSYKGPYWSPSMSTQRAVEGFEKCLRPPSFAEVLQIHWNDLYEWSNIKTVERYIPCKKGTRVVFIAYRDASCWGPTPIIMTGPTPQMSVAAIEQVSEQQSAFEELNTPVESLEDHQAPQPSRIQQMINQGPPQKRAAVIGTPDLDQCASPLSKLDLDLETGRERFFVYSDDDGQVDVHLTPVSRHREVSVVKYPPRYKDESLPWFDDTDASVILSRSNTRRIIQQSGVDPDQLLLPPCERWKKLEARDAAYEKWLSTRSFSASYPRLDRLARKLQMEVAHTQRAWMKYEQDLETKRAAAYLRASQDFFRSLKQVVYRPFPHLRIGNDDRRYQLWWKAVELSVNENRYTKWLLDNRYTAVRAPDPFDQVRKNWAYQAACGRISVNKLNEIYDNLGLIGTSRRLTPKNKVLVDNPHREPPKARLNLSVDDKRQILNERLYRGQAASIETHLKDPVFTEYALLPKQRELFDIEDETMGITATPQDVKLKMGRLTAQEQAMLISGFEFSINETSPILIPKGNISPENFGKMIGRKPDEPGVIRRAIQSFKEGLKYLG